MENGLFSDIPDDDFGVVCGADEAGRGPLAGPVTAAAVVLPDDFPIEILNDSKKMCEKERDEAAVIIKEKATAWAIVSLSHKVIDRINILVDSLLVDGNKKPDVPVYVKAIVKGDAKIPEIMAASILAKTERDRIMKLCDAKWPEYGYAKHKGYPTEEHREAILKYGPSPIERMTFRVQKDETPSLF